MRTATAPVVMALASVVVSGVAATTAFAQASSVSTRPAAQAAISALMDACKPAAEQHTILDPFAAQLGYAPDAALPSGLPITREGAHGWRVPSSAGEVHLISGALPQTAAPSACMVAIYDDPAPDLEDALTARLTAKDMGFERDVQQSFRTDRYQLTHFDRGEGDVVRTVIAARELAPVAGRPTLTIVAYRVDYSWLRSASH